MERQRYSYRVSRLNDEHNTLMAGDIFKFNIKVLYHSINTVRIERPCLLYSSSSKFIPCHKFFLEGQYFFRTLLLHVLFYMDDPEEIFGRAISTVGEQFQVNPFPSSESQPLEIPLELIIKLFDNHQYLRMIGASSEFIKMSLRRSKVVPRSEYCPICLEDLNINARCYSMACNHVFHQQCIMIWLQISRECPLCRYLLPNPLKEVKIL